ncbi:MAG: antirestriction protein ArdA [Robiginitomaculum sp.]|nr:antirestriction protein ArdA [Robiginitomaculum sp.]
MENQETEIRIYVACLAAYNSGILHGTWIDADQDASAIRAEIRTMLATSPETQAEEWAIHDYEGFEGAPIAEYQGIDSVAEIATFIAENGELGGKLLAHFHSLEYARDTLEDHYVGEYRSLSDYAQEITEETTQIPESLQFYIDYEAMARDLEINDVFTIETGFEEIHVFWSH